MKHIYTITIISSLATAFLINQVCFGMTPRRILSPRTPKKTIPVKEFEESLGIINDPATVRTLLEYALTDDPASLRKIRAPIRGKDRITLAEEKCHRKYRGNLNVPLFIQTVSDLAQADEIITTIDSARETNPELLSLYTVILQAKTQTKKSRFCSIL